VEQRKLKGIFSRLLGTGQIKKACTNMFGYHLDPESDPVLYFTSEYCKKLSAVEKEILNGCNSSNAIYISRATHPRLYRI